MNPALEYPVEPGVGAWNVPPVYQRGMTEPTDLYQQTRVRYAVIAIQTELIRREYLASVQHLDGRFGINTDKAVKAFQRDHGLVVDGKVGPKTARLLWWDLFHWWQNATNIPDNVLYGIAALESGMDPGAEGTVDDADRGIFQVNRRAHPDISDSVAFSNVPYLVQWAAGRLVDAYNTLGNWDYTIAYWNSPKWANQWATTGTAPNEQIATYVRLVRQQAANAPT